MPRMGILIDDKPTSPWWLVALGVAVGAFGLYMLSADDVSDLLSLGVACFGGLLATIGGVGVGVTMGSLRADWDRGHRWKGVL